MSILLLLFLVLCAISDLKGGEVNAIIAIGTAAVGFVSACQSGHIPVAILIAVLAISIIIFHWLGGSLHHIGEGDILLILGVLGRFWRHDAILLLTGAFFVALGVCIVRHARHSETANVAIPFAPILAAVTATHMVYQWLR